MIHGSLFTGGAAGFDFAAELAGIPTVWQCEKDPYCLDELRKNFPGVKKYPDIREMINDINNVAKPDIVSGGFPCQPFSTAGRDRKGTSDDRFLWPEMCRIIGHLRPRWVIAENVPGIIDLALSQVLFDLESIGYDFPRDLRGNAVIPCLPAAGVGAPHVRQRIFILAYNRETRSPDVSNFDRPRLPGGIFGRWFAEADRILKGAAVLQSDRVYTSVLWEKEVTSHICRNTNGLRRRVDRIRSLGNAVVPQIPFVIFAYIKQLEENNGY